MKSEVDHKFLILLLASVFNPAYLRTASSFRDTCQDVEIVTRKEWAARPFWRNWTMKLPVNHVIIQHTVTSFCYTKPQCIRKVQAMQNDHIDNQAWGDIAYNFIVGGDGRIYEGRGWSRTGTHSINFNTNSIGIAFIGNFMKDKPTKNMLDAVLNLIECGVQSGYLTPTREIHGHRDVGCTLSPGDKLYAIIRTWDNYKGGQIRDYDCQENRT